jgi:hypothetical protein
LDSTKCKTVGQAGGVLLTTTVGLAGIDPEFFKSSETDGF